MSLIEAISADENPFAEKTAGVGSDALLGGAVNDGATPAVPASEMIWCEFCKGYYLEEFHFGDTDA